ncbi:MAG: O-antigen ligase family protein, partial [Candidatus Andersenbacteria bacterium]|nr:O-antigen ligase family protein [Candidatus Andersenbacteria bacterium]
MTEVSPTAPLAMRPLFAWLLVAVLCAAFVSFFLSLQAGVFLLLFLALAWWTWEHPENGILFLLVAAPLLPMFKITQSIGTITLLKDIIILTLFARLVLVPLLQQKLPYRRNVLLAPLLALGLWVLFAGLKSDVIIVGLLRARDIILYLLLYMSVLYLAHDRLTQRRRVWWFIASALIVLWLGVYQWFYAPDSAVLRFDPLREIWLPRLSSVLAHPSIFGQYLLTLAALAGAGTLAVRGRARVLMALLCTATLPFIYFTYSRAVWLGLVVMVLTGVAMMAVRLWLKRLPRRYAALGSSAAAVSVAVLILLSMYTPAGVFLRSAFDPTYGSNEERLEFMARLIAPLSSAEALIGRGLGDVLEQNFREADVTAYDLVSGASRTVQLTKNRTLVDNQWLKTMVEMGLAGLLIYGWIFWRLAKQAVKLARSADDDRIRVWLGLT